MIDTQSFLGIGSKLFHILKDGVQHVSQMNQAGEEVSREALQFYLMMRFENWNPKIKGVKVLDAEAKTAGAAFLAGIVFNLVAELKRKNAA